MLLVVILKPFGHSSIVIGGDDADRMTSTKAVYTDITTGEPAVATVSDAVKALTGYEIKWRDYNNATADHIGITVGTKGNLVMLVLLLVLALILKTVSPAL